MAAATQGLVIPRQYARRFLDFCSVRDGNEFNVLDENVGCG
jgi:hypothetical protein